MRVTNRQPLGLEVMTEVIANREGGAGRDVNDECTTGARPHWPRGRCGQPGTGLIPRDSTIQPGAAPLRASQRKQVLHSGLSHVVD